MAVTADMTVIILAQEAAQELSLDITTMTEDNFHEIVEAIFKNISLLRREGLQEFSVQDKAKDDDQLRNFFLGKSVLRLYGLLICLYL
jgi:hypothetical protein